MQRDPRPRLWIIRWRRIRRRVKLVDRGYGSRGDSLLTAKMESKTRMIWSWPVNSIFFLPYLSILPVASTVAKTCVAAIKIMTSCGSTPALPTILWVNCFR